MADAVHDFGDSISLGLALFLQKKSELAANRLFTYGYKPLSAASALLTGVILFGACVLILWESVPRLIHSNSTPHPQGMLFLATFGIVVNGFSAWYLSGGKTHNEKILTLHLFEDLASWVAVLVGAIAIYFFQVNWLDPLLAVIIAFVILVSICKGLYKTIKLFLQSIPEEINLDDVIENIKSIVGLKELHSYHAWSMDGSAHVFTCSIKVEDKDAIKIKEEIRQTLQKEGFQHITIEIILSDSDTCH